MQIRIGEFARLGQVSIQTLRYYDELGILKPVSVDRFTSYRYYSLDQLPRLLQILALKDLGMSLDQITHLIKENMSPAELERILRLKQEELSQQVQASLDRLERINARIRMLYENEAATPYEVILKHIHAMKVVAERGLVPSYDTVSSLWMDLSARLSSEDPHITGPAFTICHATEPQIDLEVCLPVSEDCPPGLNPVTLPEVETMACTIHRGPFSGLITGFTALMQWVDANGLRIAGPDREIYLRLPRDDRYDTDPDAVTELQIPVMKPQ